MVVLNWARIHQKATRSKFIYKIVVVGHEYVRLAHEVKHWGAIFQLV
jgi:hypothetical protein